MVFNFTSRLTTDLWPILTAFVHSQNHFTAKMTTAASLAASLNVRELLLKKR
jgi:hypothetical protein